MDFRPIREVKKWCGLSPWGMYMWAKYMCCQVKTFMGHVPNPNNKKVFGLMTHNIAIINMYVIA